MGDPPVLVARLALPDGDLNVGAGEVVELPDDPRHVAALIGVAGRHRGDRITLAARRLDRLAPDARVRAGLAAVSSIEVAPDVSIRDHLAAVVGRRRGDATLAGTPLLAGRGDDPAGLLSGGERRVLAWLVADATTPRAVVLDRAGTGLDPVAFRWVHGVLDNWLDRGVAVVVRVGRDEEARWRTHRADGSTRAA